MVAAKNTPKKTSARKSTKKSAVKSAKKPVAKKPAVRKSAVKKSVAKKPAVRKSTGKTAAAKTPKKSVKKAVARTPKKSVKKVAAKRPGKKAVPAKSPKKVAPPKQTKAGTPKAKGVRKPTPKAAVQKHLKTVVSDKKKTVAKPAPKPKVEDTSRRAYGSYNGVPLCETPKNFPAHTPYAKKEQVQLLQILNRERTRLRELLRDMDQVTFSEMDSVEKMPGYSNPAEDATNNIDTETALLLRRDEEESLMQVQAALERLEGGLYGVCMACGEKIGISRLKAVPEAHLCMPCKTQYDKKSSSR